MLLNFIEEIKQIDKKIMKVMLWGLKISLLICIFSTYILVLNNCNFTYHIIYEAGIILFKTGLMFACCFFEFGFVINKLR